MPDYAVDPAKDLTCVGIVGAYQAAFAVDANTGVTSLKEYAEWVKGDPAARSQVAVTNLEVFLQVYAKYVGRELGLNATLTKPETMAGLMAGMGEHKVPACCGVVSALLEHHRSGRLRILMTSGEKRVRVLPHIPTARELGFANLSLTEWHALYVRSDTPPKLTEEWKNLAERTLADNNVAQDLVQLGIDPTPFGLKDVPAQAAAHRSGWKDRMTSVGM